MSDPVTPPSEWGTDIRGTDFLPAHTRARPFLIAHSFEPWDGGDCSRFDLLLVCCSAQAHRGCPTLRVPNAVFGLPFELLHAPASLANLPERKFAVFLTTTCWSRHYPGEVLVRLAWFEEMNAFRRVDAPGGCMNNIKIRNLPSGRGRPWYRQMVALYSQYKFVIAMDHSLVKGLVTERPMVAMMSGAIPLVFSLPDLADSLNPERFLRLNFTMEQITSVRQLAANSSAEFEHNRTSLDRAIAETRTILAEPFRELMERVKQLDEDPVLFREMAQRPIVPKKSSFNPEVIASRVRNVLGFYHSYLLTP